MFAAATDRFERVMQDQHAEEQKGKVFFDNETLMIIRRHRRRIDLQLEAHVHTRSLRLFHSPSRAYIRSVLSSNLDIIRTKLP